MLVDYHTHTNLCKHADGVAEDYVRKALDLGFDEVGCSGSFTPPERFRWRTPNDP